MKIGAIIQARMGSTRLPGKVMLPLPCGDGVPVLSQVIARVRAAANVDQVIIATTVERADDAIERYCDEASVACFRGSEHDVLERYFEAAAAFRLDGIVRVTSDCPVVDPHLVDRVAATLRNGDADYVSSALPQVHPLGVDAAAMRFTALARAHREATSKYDREHVCPYIYETARETFRIESVDGGRARHGADYRVTLDTPADYTLLCVLFDELSSVDPLFTSREIVALLQRKPWLATINGEVTNKRRFVSVADELDAAIQLLDKQDMPGAACLLREALANRREH